MCVSLVCWQIDESAANHCNGDHTDATMSDLSDEEGDLLQLEHESEGAPAGAHTPGTEVSSHTHTHTHTHRHRHTDTHSVLLAEVEGRICNG